MSFWFLAIAVAVMFYSVSVSLSVPLNLVAVAALRGSTDSERLPAAQGPIVAGAITFLPRV
jgi:hypothetical protein